jgi:hypothetical protein
MPSIKGFIFRRDQAQTEAQLASLNPSNVNKRFALGFQAVPREDVFLEVIDRMQQVKELYVSVECRGAKEAESLALNMLSRLKHITDLVLLAGWKSPSLEPLIALRELQRLDISPGYCKKQSLLPLIKCPSLRTISIWRITSDLAATLAGKSWSKIHLEEVKSIKDKAKVNCQELRLGACPKEVVASVSQGRARIISIIASKNISDLTFIERVDDIESIRLCELPNITHLDFGEANSRISNLWIHDLTNLELTPSIKTFTNLKYLRITGRSSITKEQLLNLNALKKLNQGLIIIRDGGKFRNDLYGLKDVSPIEHDRLFNVEVDPKNYD